MSARPPRQRSSSGLRVRRSGVALAIAAFVVVQVRAQSFGSGGTGMAILVGLLGVLVLDAAWSLVALRSRGLWVGASAPADATVGEPTELSVTVAGRRGPLTVRVDGPGSSRWARVMAPCRGTLAFTPPRRGMFEHVDVTLAHALPLGLVGVERTVTVALGAPLVVAPSPRDVGPVDVRSAALDAARASRPSVEPELFRGTRPYLPGDSPRRVHWPHTARTGKLMIREHDQATRPIVHVRCDLGPVPGEDAERAASLAAGLLGRLLASGMVVQLETWERGGRRAEPVRSPLDAGRRLGLADIAPVATWDATVPGTSVVVVDAAGWRVETA